MKPSDFIIIVLAYARPDLLRSVLESLQRQQVLAHTEVWIDGTADRIELRANVRSCAETASKFPVASIRSHAGHLGIEKLMLDALSYAAEKAEDIIVFEDDCFPTRSAVSMMRMCLEEERDNRTVFSVYGHPFFSPRETDYFPRFQGWGWATSRDKLIPVLEKAKTLFQLSEKDYLAYTQAALTSEVVARLDITPGRDVCGVLRKFFSWDSCTALLCAQSELVHRKTPTRVVYNCGLGGDSGHFPVAEHLRRPPFNMVLPSEVWNHF